MWRVWLVAALLLAGCAPPYCVPRPVQNHAPVCRWWECPALHQAAF